MNYPGVQTYIVSKDKKLSISHSDDLKIDLSDLESAVDAFEPPEKISDEVSKKEISKITLGDVVKVLIEKGIIEKGGS